MSDSRRSKMGVKSGPLFTDDYIYVNSRGLQYGETGYMSGHVPSTKIYCRSTYKYGMDATLKYTLNTGETVTMSANAGTSNRYINAPEGTWFVALNFYNISHVLRNYGHTYYVYTNGLIE